METETWIDVSQPFTARYQVSSLGRVRDKLRNNRILAQTRSTLKGKPGYMKVSLRIPDSKKFKHASVHRLVAIAFVPGDHSLDVNHDDLDKTNNLPSNLIWSTHGDNIRHGMERVFGWKDRLLAAGLKRRRPVVSTDQDGVVIEKFDSIAHAARSLGNSNRAGNIKHAIDIGNSAYGFRWAYAD